MPRPLWSTQNDLAEKVRRDVVDLLNQHLADAFDLGLQAKQAHWNVKGPSFIALHELFDHVHGQVVEFADDIAERAVGLGGTALGTAPTIAKASRLPDYPSDIDSGRQHVAALSASVHRDLARRGQAAVEGGSARAGERMTVMLRRPILVGATIVALLAVTLAGCAVDWQTTMYDPRRSCEPFGGRYLENDGTCRSGQQ